MIKRSSKLFVDNLLKNNPNWNILDIGCGYSADKNANVICDIQDLSNFYKDKKFIKLINAKLPFILIEDGYTEKKTNEIYHDYLVKDFIGLEKIIKKYL